MTALVVVGTLLVVAAFASMLLRGRPLDVLYTRWMLHNVPSALVLLWLGWLLARRHPQHGMVPVFLWLGACAAVHVVLTAIVDPQLVAAGLVQADVIVVPADLPLTASIPLWIVTWIWLPPAALSGPLLLLLFPDGQLLHPRWAVWVRLAFVATALLIAGYAISTWPTVTTLLPLSGQPIVTPVATALVVTGGILALVAGLAAIASMVVRWRVASPAERQPMRIVGTAGAVFILVLLSLWTFQAIWVPASLVAIVGVLGAYSLAILRYRLHDIDVAINRAVVASLLLALVTAIYLAVVVGVGSVVGRRADHELLPLLAVGLVAVLFEPARRRVRRYVDRVSYGRDADAYEVLAELAAELRGAATTDVVAERVTELLVRGTGAAGASITMLAAGRQQPVSSSGAGVDHPAVLSAEIVHDGEPLGLVSLHARTGSDIAPDAATLLHDVAGTLGPVLRNAALTAQLQEQVEELRRSRQRLVSAQDEARRALERDIHDGAQARLVALRLQVGLAAAAADRHDDDVVTARLDAVGTEVDSVIRTLRDLSRGLHPPVLATDGVAAALRAAVRGLPIDVDVEAGSIGRFPQAVEAAVYFSCLEAVKNATTHAAASRIRVVLANGDGRLRFAVEDDGCGFDPETARRGGGLRNLEDRIAALDGHLEVEAVPGAGTRVVGELPVPVAALAPQPPVSER
jgi:two-component system, NarL family, sensor kinase